MWRLSNSEHLENVHTNVSEPAVKNYLDSCDLLLQYVKYSMNCVNSTSAENDLDWFADISWKYFLIGKLDLEDVQSLWNFLKNNMMTSSNGNKKFRVTGPLCGEFTSHRWIPFTKDSEAELWCFLWSAPEQTVVQTIETPVIWNAIAMFECISVTYANAYGAWLISTGQWSCNNCIEVRLTVEKYPFQCYKDSMWIPPILPIKIMIRKKNQSDRFHIRPKCIPVRD